MRRHSFSDIVTDVTSKFSKIKASEYLAQGKYKIIDQGKGPVAGYIDDSTLVNGEILPILIFGDHTRVLKYIEEPIALGADGAKALWVNPDLANARYVYYFLRSIHIKESGYSRHFKFLREVEIPIPFKDGTPDFDSQIRIAYLLGKVEGLIFQRRQYRQQLDDLLRSVFVEMFGDPVGNNKGWGKHPLRTFGSVSTGNTPPRNDASNYDGRYIEWVKTDNIGVDSIYVTKAAEYLSKSGAKRARTVSKGALLVACIAGSVESIGRAALTDRKVAFNQQINAIQPASDVSPLFLYGLFKLSRSYIQTHASKGMKKILTKGDFERIALIKPPLVLQERFSSIAEKIESAKGAYQQSLEDLETLYGALSQKAFKGELDLSRVPIPNAETKGLLTATLVDAPVLVAPPTAINLPDTGFLLAALNDRARFGELLQLWLESYRRQLNGATFSAQAFLAAAQIRVAELHPDNHFDLGIAAYEEVKTWVFDSVKSGEIKQTRNTVAIGGERKFGNEIVLRARKSRRP